MKCGITMALPWSKKKDAETLAEEATAASMSKTLGADSFLDTIRPKEGLFFNSDYFAIDKAGVAQILTMVHNETARDDFYPFWGVSLIPHGLPDGASVVILDKKKRRDEAWIRAKKKTSEQLVKMNDAEMNHAGADSQLKNVKIKNDQMEVTRELANGDAYVHSQVRMLLKAPSLEVLDEAREVIRQQYIGSLGTISVEPDDGLQRKELSSLWRDVDAMTGSGFDLTSSELGGMYNLVTTGLSDPTGEFVGSMMGDINTSAVNFDINHYRSHVVIADESKHPVYKLPMTQLWGSKLSQCALENNGRVVHLVLDGTDLDQLGPRFDSLSSRIDIQRGELNMFETFGEVENELAIYSANATKLTLMMNQFIDVDGEKRTIIDGLFRAVLDEFYKARDMWIDNASANRHKVRMVGLPHEQYPRLQHFVAFLKQKYNEIEAAGNETNRDLMYTLFITFKDLLNSEGDLFNQITKASVDGAKDARRVVYDFSALRLRNPKMAMAQLINVTSFATNSLGAGDTLIIHGTEVVPTFDENGSVAKYLKITLDELKRRGGRVVYLYNSVESALDDQDFNTFDAAHYTIFGTMREPVAKKYQQKMEANIPADLHQLITNHGELLAYMHRGFVNVVFKPELVLGTEHDPKYEKLKSTRGKKSSTRLRKKVVRR